MKLKRRVKGAMVYPISVLCIAFIVVAVLLTAAVIGGVFLAKREDMPDPGDRERPERVSRRRPATLQPGKEIDDPHGRERIAALTDVRRVDDRIGQACRRRPQRTQADGDGWRVGHGRIDLRVNH